MLPRSGCSGGDGLGSCLFVPEGPAIFITSSVQFPVPVSLGLFSCRMRSISTQPLEFLRVFESSHNWRTVKALRLFWILNCVCVYCLVFIKIYNCKTVATFRKPARQTLQKTFKQFSFFAIIFDKLWPHKTKNRKPVWLEVLNMFE